MNNGDIVKQLAVVSAVGLRETISGDEFLKTRHFHIFSPCQNHALRWQVTVVDDKTGLGNAFAVSFQDFKTLGNGGIKEIVQQVLSKIKEVIQITGDKPKAPEMQIAFKAQGHPSKLEHTETLNELGGKISYHSWSRIIA